MNTEANEKLLEETNCRELFQRLYDKDAETGRERYRNVLKGYREHFGEGEVSMFTSAGRTEVCGNHTDHNHGKILAGSIDLDCVAAAGRTEDQSGESSRRRTRIRRPAAR